MSEDLIRRSDAIEAIEVVDWYHQNRNKDMVSGANSDEHQAWYKADDIYKALEAVPSADRPIIYGNEHNCIMTIFGECSYAETGCGDCAVVENVRKALSTGRPQGEWIGYNADKGSDWLRSDGEPIFLVCNKCHGTVMNNTSAHWNFCPNCGADMRKGADDEQVDRCRCIERKDR